MTGPACLRSDAFVESKREAAKTKGPAISRQALKVLVGRVGIEPTTNGLRVQRTRVTGARKGKKRNGRLARERTPALRPNLCRTKSRRWGSGVVSFKPRQRLSRQRRTVPERAPSGQFLVTNKRRYCASDCVGVLSLLVILPTNGGHLTG